MPPALTSILEPRKSPVQARSAASVEAILDATIQVLLSIGKERLTTTRVAQRAGVSVGTLYQYFPNKSALLQAALSRHLLHVADTIERTCLEQRGNSLAEMARTLIQAFYAAKMQHIQTSIALYQVSSDVDAVRIVRQTAGRSHTAIAAMLSTAPEGIRAPEMAATIVQGALAGISRRILESPSPEKHLPGMQQETITLVTAYLHACAQTTPVPAALPGHAARQ